MLTLTSTLQAAQQQVDVLPVVKVVVADIPPEVPRMSDLALVYNGTEGDGVNDATWTNDGLIGRIYIDPSSGNVYGQVQAASAQSGWGTWTTLATGAYLSSGAGACCCYGYQNSSQRVDFFWVDSTGYTIKTASCIAGTFGSASTVYNAGAGIAIASLACDGQDPTLRVIFAEAGLGLFETHWTGSAWSAPVSDGGSWTNPTISYGFRPLTAPSGDGNGYVILCWGAPQQTVTVKQFNVSGGSWGGSQVIQTYGVGTGYTCTFPKHTETSSACRRATTGWIETGPSPFGAQALMCVTPSHSYVTEVVPWRYMTNATRGVKLLPVVTQSNGGPYWFVVGANQVYRTLADGSDFGFGEGLFYWQRLTFAEDQIESLSIDQPGLHKPAKITIVLSNEGGVLSGAGVENNTAGWALRRWSQVVISLGYHSSAGDETVWQLPCWIEEIAFSDDAIGVMTSSGGAGGIKTGPKVTLTCTDPWGMLERMRFRWATTIANDNPADLAKKVVFHVAGDLTWIPDSLWSAVALSTFTFRAGEALALALRRLLDSSGDVLFFRTFQSAKDGAGWDSVQIVSPRWATGGSVYTYAQLAPSQGALSAGVHPILRSKLAPLAAPSGNSLQVNGKTTVSLFRNWASIWDLWHELEADVVDKTLTTQAATDQVATNRGQYLVPEAWAGSFEANANVGLELGDQVAITVPTAPVSGLVFTVSAILTSWDRRRGLLWQRVTVEGTN